MLGGWVVVKPVLRIAYSNQQHHSASSTVELQWMFEIRTSKVRKMPKYEQKAVSFSVKSWTIFEFIVKWSSLVWIFWCLEMGQKCELSEIQPSSDFRHSLYITADDSESKVLNHIYVVINFFTKLKAFSLWKCNYYLWYTILSRGKSRWIMRCINL